MSNHKTTEILIACNKSSLWWKELLVAIEQNVKLHLIIAEALHNSFGLQVILQNYTGFLVYHIYIKSPYKGMGH